MHRRELTIETTGRQVVDVTDEVLAFAQATGGDGLLNVFVPHATAGVAVIETGAGSEDDLVATVERLFPRDERYRHRHGSPGHGADHVVPAFIAPSLTVPVRDGDVTLGTWQRIVVVDPNRDNDRRQVTLSFLADAR